MEMGKKYSFVFFSPCREMRLRNEWLKIANIKSVASAVALRVAGGVGWCWVAVLARRMGGRTESIPAVFGTKAGGSQPWQAAQFIAQRQTAVHTRTPKDNLELPSGLMCTSSQRGRKRDEDADTGGRCTTHKEAT